MEKPGGVSRARAGFYLRLVLGHVRGSLLLVRDGLVDMAIFPVYQALFSLSLPYIKSSSPPSLTPYIKHSRFLAPRAARPPRSGAD